MSKPLVLIPSATLIPVELQAEFGPITPAMIPVDGRPALHYIMDQYLNADFAVAVNQAGGNVRAYCSRHIEGCDVQVTDVGHTASLGETIYKALAELGTLPDTLVVNFADTAVPSVRSDQDVVYYTFQEDVYRWTTFDVDDQDRIIGLNEKDTEKQDPEKSQRVFVGVFCFTRVKAFLDLLDNYVGNSGDIDPFYEALKHYYEVKPPVLAETDTWYDFGHLDTYYESRKKLSAVCRHFNTIQVDSTRGTITKRSQNADKFIDEIQWYLKLPKQLQHIAPRVFDYNLDYQAPSVELEFYGYPVLNDLYLYGHLDLGAWARIFKAVELVLEDMARFCTVPESSDAARQALGTIYERKTLDRMLLYKDLPEFAWAQGSDVKVNGIPASPLNRIFEQLPSMLDRAGVYETNEFSVIHGDLCFSNILYDRRNGIIRVIDPRGSFGPYDIYGDPAYDLCKLSHSIEGDYDFLVNGLFDLEQNGSACVLDAHLTARQQAVKALYRERVQARLGHREYLKIRLLESLLFLSMIPLHNDRPRSQQAFLARGLELFSHIEHEVYT